MNMYLDDIIEPISSMDISSLSPFLTPAAASVFSTSKLLASDSALEIEVLNDVSHVALDMSTLFGPNTAWLRLWHVIGRILVLSMDYIQDASPEEWLFQAAAFGVSVHMFLRSSWPLIQAGCSALTVRDLRAYALLFEAVGLTVLQFKTLLSSNTVDWVEYAPDESVELDGEYMYILYSGEAGTPVASSARYSLARNSAGSFSITDSTDFSNNGEGEEMLISNRIFGDVYFAKTLETSLYKKAKKSSTSKSDKKSKSPDMIQETADSSTTESSPQQGRFVVGPNGAVMLRISTSKLLKLMEDDDELSNSIQRLILLSMQEKLSRSPQEEGGPRKANGSASSSTPNATPPNIQITR
jgi:hypothetical protein